MPIETIAFDADDTLWHNENFFRITEEKFQALLAPYAPAERLGAQLLTIERRNLARYGYGVKGFTLSMIETALEVSDGQVPGHVIAKLLSEGRDLLGHPVEVLPGVEETLRTLARDYRLICITKGDLLHQEEKVAASGLGELFAAVHVVSEKTEATYASLIEAPERAVMVGNSMRSDILPALAAGLWAVHVPYALEWAHEAAPDPEDASRFHRVENVAALPQLLPSLG
ncbi:MAG: HAD family hydrolase [Shimia sp.]